MTIRLMTMQDYDAVYALWFSCKGMRLNGKDDSRQGVERFLMRNPRTCFVAENEGKIVGAIMSGHDGRRGYIYHAAVSASARRRGIGSALVDAVIDALRREGIAKIALVAFEHNEQGNAFWEKTGFSVRGDLLYRNKAILEMERMDT